MGKTQKEKTFKSFDDFTNLYEISKTLQFGLIPLRWDENDKSIVGDCDFTEMKKHEIIEKDGQTAKRIKVAKFYLDILHRELIEKGLKNLKFKKKDLEELSSLRQKLEKNKKNKQISRELKKKLSIIRDRLLKEVGNAFIGNDNEDGKDILLSKHCLEKLRERFTKEEVEKLRKNNQDAGVVYFDVVYRDKGGEEKSVFDMDAGYLDDFHKNREHLYSIKGKKGSLARRILDNFEIFNGNKKIFEEKYKNSDIDFSEVEKNFNVRLNDIFDFDFYNRYILQENIDGYNKILGGESRKQERKAHIQGLNQKINLHTQQKEKEYKEQKKEKGQKRPNFNKKNYPTFKPLQKQILSSLFRKEILIENDADLIRELENFIEKSRGKTEKAKEIVNLFCSYGKNNLDLAKIYLPKSKINSFANKVFKEPQEFMAVYRDGRANLELVNFDTIKTYLENHKLEYKDFYKKIVQEKQDIDDFLFVWKREIDILIDGGETIIKGGKKENIVKLETKRKKLEEKLRWFKEKVRKDEKMSDEEEGAWCQAVLDYSQTVLDITKRAETFWLNEKQEIRVGDNKDGVFYPQFSKFTDDDFVPFIYLDKFRNYLNKRSRNTAKNFKLYFNADHLLDGWDINMEPQYLGFLLRKKNDYYLGIGNKNGEIFHKRKSGGDSVEKVLEAYDVKDGDDFYEKIEYKQLDIGKFEGIAFPKKKKDKQGNYRPWDTLKEKENTKRVIKEFGLTEEIFNLKKSYDEFSEGRRRDKTWDKKFDKEKQNKLLDYYIKCLSVDSRKDDWGRFKFQFKKPEEYEDRRDFVNHLQRQAYWIKPERVNKGYVDEKVKNGEMFLFRIHNKDFYDAGQKMRKNKENLFTRYFHELFSEENLENIRTKDVRKSIFELDGKAEIRFRRKTDNIKLKFYKKEGKIITCANKKDGNKEKEVIEHRRFAKDALILHLKIRLNFGKEIEPQEFNKTVNTKLLAKAPVEVLGIDRGENNLIYYCLLNEKGEIENCASWNKVGERIKKLKDGTEIKEPVDYFKLLVDREEKRDWEQKNWQKITPIKDLKKGYLANVINEITKIVSANIDKGVATIIALEDLSQNFKRARFFRERQIYQGFEKDLINKLNYLVDKNKKNHRQAYQFAFRVDSVEKMEKEKQIGALFYVNASYTSKICPAPKCGWRQRLYIKNSETKGKIINALKSIEIFYEKEKDRFRFKYQWEQEYKKEGKKEKYNGIDTIFSSVSRLRYDREKNKTESYKDGTKNSITNKIKDLFNDKGINIAQDVNITEEIIKKEKELDAKFFRDLINYFNLILQIRNYDKENGDDYIQCPACGFHSNKPPTELELIKNGDANGAYNIARKGLILAKRIKEKPEKLNLIINNKDWDKFVQNQWNPISKFQN